MMRKHLRRHGTIFLIFSLNFYFSTELNSFQTLSNWQWAVFTKIQDKLKHTQVLNNSSSNKHVANPNAEVEWDLK